MRIIISPAKKMKGEAEFEAKGLPKFLTEAERVFSVLRGLDRAELKKLYRASDDIVTLNYERIRETDLRKGLTPALFSYEGIQYQYMAPEVFDERELSYVEEHLRILSGLYGLLRPFDGVVPYRLEMASKLAVDGHKNLYAFWGAKLAEELAAETDVVVDLASDEYGKAVAKHLPKGVRRIRCVFGEADRDRVVEKGTMCKMARGGMVRYLASNGITDPERMKDYDEDYFFSEAHSDAETYVFLKREQEGFEWND